MSYNVCLPNYSIGADCYKEIPYFARYYGKKGGGDWWQNRHVQSQGCLIGRDSRF